MNIQLVSTKAIHINLIPGDSKELDNDTESFKFNYDIDFPETYENTFFVIINSLLEDPEYSFKAVYLAEFKLDEELDERFKSSKFPYVNAPAIAYPFFRAFIANTLVNCGFEPTYLPSVNFEALYKIKKKEEK